MLVKCDVCVNSLTNFYVCDVVKVRDALSVKISFQVTRNFVGVASNQHARKGHYATTSLSGFDFLSSSLTILSKEPVRPLTFATRVANVS